MAHYRHDIDGLRAIAVIAVVIGHTFERILPGGYLGVDVFFAISGFVIAQSLLTKGDVGFRPFLAGFFLRRIKRLLPALLVCFFITSAVLLFIDTTPKASLITGATSLFGFSNFSLYAQQLDYFSASIKYNAFTHTWSLGVEEQFYLVFPFVFWIVLRASPLRNTTALAILISVACLVSLGAFLALQDTAAVTAYYMMPTRFWEIGAGVVVALLVHRGMYLPAVLAGIIPTTILIILLGVLFALSSSSIAPGHVVAVALTALLLWGGASAQRPHVALSNPVSRYIGRISYSLYLWHWPFLTFGLLAVGSAVADPFVAITAAFGAAILSYHFVEQPVRKRPTPVVKLRYFGLALASIFAVIIVIGVGNDYRKNLDPAPFESALRPAFMNLPESDLPFNPTCVVTVHEPERLLQPDTFAKCTLAPKPGGDPRTLWVIGDSHTGHLQGGLLKLHEQDGFGLHLVETPGHGYPSTFPEGFEPRERLMEDVRANWKAGDIIVLGRLLLTRSETVEAYGDVPEWLVRVEALVQEVNASGLNVLLLGPPPLFPFEDIRACDPLDVLSCGVERETLMPVIEEIHRGMDAIADRHENVAVLHVFDEVCPPATPICSPVREGIFTFRDRDHFNVYGAELLMDSFRGALAEFEN